MSDPLDVLGVGTIAVDEILTLEGYPEEDSKVRVLARRRRLGGITAAALAAAARLGARAAISGALGDDEDSRFARAALAELGIDLSFLASDPAAHPFRGTILTVSGSATRTILSEPGESGTVAIPQLPRARIVLVDHHTPLRAIPAIARLRAQGAQVVADLERDTPAAAELMALADHLILPLAGARRRVGAGASEAPGALLERLAQPGRLLTAITDGERGVWFATASERRWQPAFVVAAIDTTGCGDTFHGAYAAAAARGESAADCVRGAAAAAALKACHPQGLPPDRASVAAFLAERAAAAAATTAG